MQEGGEFEASPGLQSEQLFQKQNKINKTQNQNPRK